VLSIRKAIFMIALFVLVPSFAQTESAVAGTPAINCAVNHQVASGRHLSSVKRTKLRSLCQQAHKSASVVHFWRHKGHWALHARYQKCWDVPWPDRERLCYKARRSLRAHAKRLAWAKERIERLTAPILLLGNVHAWLCIHRNEGSWTNVGSKYRGGLQMDFDFMSTYGPPALGYKSWDALYRAKGMADQWTPNEQIAVAEYARTHGRGYYPWPKTAADCGLI
jgi:hypothetical protein